MDCGDEQVLQITMDGLLREHCVYYASLQTIDN